MNEFHRIETETETNTWVDTTTVFAPEQIPLTNLTDIARIRPLCRVSQYFEDAPSVHEILGEYSAKNPLSSDRSAFANACQVFAVA